MSAGYIAGAEREIRIAAAVSLASCHDHEGSDVDAKYPVPGKHISQRCGYGARASSEVKDFSRDALRNERYDYAELVKRTAIERRAVAVGWAPPLVSRVSPLPHPEAPRGPA